MASRTKKELPDIGRVSLLKLDNGLSVYVRENHAAPVVSVQGWVKSGSIHEAEFMGCGLSHFLEHMLFQGTENYSAAKITDIIHRNGGEMNAYTSFACTVYYADLLSSAACKAADVISEMIFMPEFPEKMFKTEKGVILRERAMVRDNPDRTHGEQLWQTVFLQHPVRHPIIGYEDKIKSVNRVMMREFHHRQYTPGRVFLVVSGDVVAEDIFKEISSKCSGISRGTLVEPLLPQEPRQVGPRAAVSYFDDPLARVSIAFRIPPSSHEDSTAISLLSAVLSQGKSSRLVSNLRDKSRLAIHIDSFSYSSVFDGVFAVSASCRPEDLNRLERAIRSELLKMHDCVSSEELKRVKNNIITRQYRNFRMNDSVAGLIGWSVINYGTHEYACKYLEDILAADAAQLKDAARKYLDMENCCTVKLLPSESSAKATRKGKVVSERGKDVKPVKHTMENGCRMILLEDHSLPLVDLSLVLPGGRFFEPEGLAGISGIVAKLMLAGTGTLTEDKLSRTLDNNAIRCSVSGGLNTLCLNMSFHSRNLDLARRLLASVLSEPSFKADKFRREQAMMVEMLKSRALNPLRTAEDALLKALFGGHPYSLPPCGTRQSILALSPGCVRDFYYGSCLNPERLVVGIAGDIDPDNAHWFVSELGRAIRWSRSCAAGTAGGPEFPDKPAYVNIEVPREQSVVMVGLPGCSNTSEDRFALDFLQTALNGLETRLFKTIRNNAGLAYYTGLLVSRGIHAGHLGFYAGTSPAASDRVISLIHDEIDKLRKNGLSKTEFELSLARLKGSLAEQKLNIADEISASAISEYYGNGYLEQWCLWDIYSGINPGDVNRVIRKYLSCPNAVTVVAMGTAAG